MVKRGLIISIEYSDRFCQACYYSERHGGPESILMGADAVRYQMPSVLCYDPETDEWTVGNDAVQMSSKPGTMFFNEFMRNVRIGTCAFVNGKEYSYKKLMAIFFEKMLQFIQIRTSMMVIKSITVAMRITDYITKVNLEEIFSMLNIPPSQIRLMNLSESFGHYALSESNESWQNGALLFDFCEEGFWVRQLSVIDRAQRPLVCVQEYDLSSDFSIGRLSSDSLSESMDRNLADIYRNLTSSGECANVYFTGEGFEDPWFETTLSVISSSVKAFRGNNIYVKGACYAGYMHTEAQEEYYTLICPGMTKSDISVQARENGKIEDIILSPAALNWYDAGYSGDFILENETDLTFKMTSILDQSCQSVNIDLSAFPKRPTKATRVQVDIEYNNESKCTITVTDKGFGDFYRDGGTAAFKTVNLEGKF